MFIEGFTAITW